MSDPHGLQHIGSVACQVGWDVARMTALIALVFSELRERLTAADGAALATRLPRDLRSIWEASADEAPAAERVELLGRVLDRIHVASADEAERAVIAVLRFLQLVVAPTPAAPIRLSGLPRDLAFLWSAAARQRTAGRRAAS